jgi:hypothetical protein
LLNTAGYPDERIQALNADHRKICKFDNPNDTNFRTLRNRLASTVEEIEKTGKYPLLLSLDVKPNPISSTETYASDTSRRNANSLKILERFRAPGG